MDRRIFGEDAERFPPERWFEATSEELKNMDRGFLAVSISFFVVRIERG
jgi:hypothetical protein